jgi:hypothetical protein
MTRGRRAAVLLGVAAVAAGALTTMTAGVSSAAANRYEAENATISQGAVNSDHPGFTGTGFVNYDNVIGSSVEFTVMVTGAQTAPLNFRFANGTSTNRPMDIAINGTLMAGGRACAGTGAWTAWQTSTINAALVDGVNTVKATATSTNGGPNLDSLTVGDGGAATDWSVAMVESTMARFTPSTIGGWSTRLVCTSTANISSTSAPTTRATWPTSRAG